MVYFWLQRISAQRLELSLGGFFISRLGTNYVVFAGLLFIVLAGVVVWWQVRELAGEKEDNELGFEKSVWFGVNKKYVSEGCFCEKNKDILIN